MLKTIESIKSTIRLGKGGVGVGSDGDDSNDRGHDNEYLS